DWVHHPTSATVRALIQVRPGAALRVRERVAQLATGSLAASTTPDLFIAELSPAALRAAARDRDVARLSFDALVRSLDTKRLGDDHVLGTQGMLIRKRDNGES